MRATLTLTLVLAWPLAAVAQSLPSPHVNGLTVDGAISGGSVTAAGGTTSRTLANHAGDAINLMDLGAACDDSTNDTTAITAAITAARPIYIPAGKICRTSTYSHITMAGRVVGPGRIRASDGNLLAPLFTGVQAAPSGNDFSSITTSFNGTQNNWAHEHMIAGTATLGLPTTGYSQPIDASGSVLRIMNRSGHNESLAGNGGRTGTAGFYTKLDQYGQGDMTAYFCGGIVASSLSGATNFLASPQISCIGGDLYAGVDGNYLQGLGDLNFTDNGHDIAVAGTTLNFHRTNAAGTLSSAWIADIRQIGTPYQPIDALYRATGKAAAGIDFGFLSLDYYRIASITVGAGGSGYVVGDNLTVSGGTAISPTILTVATVDGSGAILTVSPATTGIYTVPPVTTYTSLTLTGGTGTGATISGYYDWRVAFQLPANGGCIKPVEAASTINSQLSGFQAAFCITRAGITFGPGNSVPTTAGANNIVLGPSNTLLGSGNTVVGTGVYDVAQQGSFFIGSGTFTGAGAGKAQTSFRILRAAPSGTTAARLTTSQGSASAQNTYNLLAGSAHTLSIQVTAIDQTNGDAASWSAKTGMATRTTGGNATYTGAMTSATTPDFSTGAGSTATMQVTADTTLQALNLTFTPPTANAHVWHVIARLAADQVQ